MKKFLLTHVLALMAIANTWAYDAYVNGIYYNLDTSAKTAQVTSGGNEYTGSVNIPSSIAYNGTTYSVTSIGQMAFMRCADLTSVTIPNSVTNIGRAAFHSCQGLASITIPNSVTNIDSLAFFRCTGFTSITIPKSVASIGFGAFSDCPNVETIIVEEGNPQYFCDGNCVIDKDNCLVFGCKNSEIPPYVTSIGDTAFRECYNLTSITIPNSVTSIGFGAFEGCDRLTEIVIPGLVTHIGDHAFENCRRLTSINIPNSVVSIGECAFHYCTRLTSVILGTGITEIEYGTFFDCKALNEMVCKSPNLISCFEDAFDDSGYKSGTLYVPASLIGAYRTTAPWYNWGSIKTLDDWAAGIELPTTHTDASPIYDLQGRRLNEAPSKGIYIQNGKKYRAK